MGYIKQQVALVDARFFAYHGYYSEEQVLGNQFWVNIRITFDGNVEAAEKLENTVNYQTLHAIAGEEMRVPRKLLETVAHAILDRVRTCFPFAEEAEVRIHKGHPPFGGDAAGASVALTWHV